MEKPFKATKEQPFPNDLDEAWPEYDYDIHTLGVWYIAQQMHYSLRKLRDQIRERDINQYCYPG